MCLFSGDAISCVQPELSILPSSLAQSRKKNKNKESTYRSAARACLTQSVMGNAARRQTPAANRTCRRERSNRCCASRTHLVCGTVFLGTWEMCFPCHWLTQTVTSSRSYLGSAVISAPHKHFTIAKALGGFDRVSRIISRS